MEYIIGTDGACKGNPGPGTWAFVVFDGTKMLGHKKGHSKQSTNNIMEMTAMLEALSWCNRHKVSAQIKTDSSYVLNGLSSWLTGWKSKGWKNAKGQEVANRELWQSLDVQWQQAKGRVTISKVKGHSGDVHNEAADMYCNEEYINRFC